MTVYLGDVVPRKDKPQMTEEEFWAALAATKDAQDWDVEWDRFNKHWHIRGYIGEGESSAQYCPVTAVAMQRTDNYYETCEWDDSISSTTGINLPYEFAYKVVNAADDADNCSPETRARLLDVLGLTGRDRTLREALREGGAPEETQSPT